MYEHLDFSSIVLAAKMRLVSGNDEGECLQRNLGVKERKFVSMKQDPKTYTEKIRFQSTLLCNLATFSSMDVLLEEEWVIDWATEKLEVSVHNLGYMWAFTLFLSMDIYGSQHPNFDNAIPSSCHASTTTGAHAGGSSTALGTMSGPVSSGAKASGSYDALAEIAQSQLAEAAQASNSNAANKGSGKAPVRSPSDSFSSTKLIYNVKMSVSLTRKKVSPRSRQAIATASTTSSLFLWSR